MFFFLISISVVQAHASGELPGESQRLSSKLGVRYAAGMLINNGKFKGTLFTYTALDLLYLSFISPKFALGAGYYVELDTVRGIVPFYGWNLSSRYYFYGQGTRSQRAHELVYSERLDRLALFAGPELSQRNYYRGSNSTDTAEELTGSYYSLNGVVGLDYTLSETIQFQAEGSLGLLAFAASDNRFMITNYHGKFGFTFVW